MRVGKYKLSKNRRAAYRIISEGGDFATIMVELGIHERQARQYVRDFAEDQSMDHGLAPLDPYRHLLVEVLLVHGWRIESDAEFVAALRQLQNIEARMNRGPYQLTDTPLRHTERRLQQVAPDLLHLVPGRGR